WPRAKPVAQRSADPVASGHDQAPNADKNAGTRRRQREAPVLVQTHERTGGGTPNGDGYCANESRGRYENLRERLGGTYGCATLDYRRKESKSSTTTTTDQRRVN